MTVEIILDDCVSFLQNTTQIFDLTFLDPPFNQKKVYRVHRDDMGENEYWSWIKQVCQLVYDHTSDGGAIYFMQREKNAHLVIQSLFETQWIFQNLIIWKKKTSAVPEPFRYGKHFQIIVFATKGSRPRVFNKLRIDPPLLVTEKYKRPNGVYVTDVWDDIRELTSGYYAGDEPLRFRSGERVHNQQSPISLLLRIILSSTIVGDWVLDPFAGTGTTLRVASQLNRNSIGIEIDPVNVDIAIERLRSLRECDSIGRYFKDYRYTENLRRIWPEIATQELNIRGTEFHQATLFERNNQPYEDKN
jgi:DNA modification methylase